MNFPSNKYIWWVYATSFLSFVVDPQLVNVTYRIPLSSSYFEILVVVQLAKKYPSFYVRFITVATKAP
jgi:hypothetical protein